MPDTQDVIIDAIKDVMRARNDDEELPVTVDSRLSEDLRLDSLELAEVSERLTDALGRDPYNEGLAPDTVGDVVAFYEG